MCDFPHRMKSYYFNDTACIWTLQEADTTKDFVPPAVFTPFVSNETLSAVSRMKTLVYRFVSLLLSQQVNIINLLFSNDYWLLKGGKWANQLKLQCLPASWFQLVYFSNCRSFINIIFCCNDKHSLHPCDNGSNFVTLKLCFNLL